MKVNTDSTWHLLAFDNGKTWQVSRYDYVKLLEKLLTPKQFEKDFKKDGSYNVSKKRYLQAKEFFENLKR